MSLCHDVAGEVFPLPNNTTAQFKTPLAMTAWETDNINEEIQFERSIQLGTLYCFIVSQQAQHSNKLHVPNARAHDGSSTLADLLNNKEL